MGLVVQKFGGTSVADTNKIKQVAKLVKNSIAQGDRIVVVVSAMAGATNQLITLCNNVSKLNELANLKEYDTALSSGETIVAALLALSLQDLGVSSRSILAWQLPITANNEHSNAKVKDINIDLLQECLKQDITPIIAGFQGITSNNQYVTLGRGGSDTTASLIAASIKADRCDIYTDVEGVFTADPRIITHAQKLSIISFEEMLELSSSGAKVLHPRSVEIAMRYNIPIRVISTFLPDSSGTLVTSKDNIMENTIISGITSNKNLLKLNIHNSQIDLNKICFELAQHNIHVEWVLNIQTNENYSFIIQLNDKNKLEGLLNDLKIDFTFDIDIATVSLVGYGIKNDNNFIQKIFKTLNEESMLIFAAQISEIKISLLIEENKTEKIIRMFHQLLF